MIYARSNLVPALVSSKVYRQLEFLAVGSWWIHDANEARQGGSPEGEEEATTILQDQKILRKIPGSREDVFADKSIDLRSTRSLMKVLKLAADAGAHSTIVSESGDQPWPDYLASRYNIGSKLQAPLQALTLSPAPPSRTSVAYAVPQMHRHLTSIGIFGPGFGAVVPKWGGLAEIAQVACRAGAVGGGVYVLKIGIESIDIPVQPPASPTTAERTDHLLPTIKLEGGDEVKARWIIGTPSTLHNFSAEIPKQQMTSVEVTHITAIISSALTSLFPPPAEGSPPPASTVAVLPPGTIRPLQSLSFADMPAIYLIIHSSDTGECPEGQCTSLSFPSVQNRAYGVLRTPFNMRKSDDPTIEYLSTLSATYIDDNITSDNLIPQTPFHILRVSLLVMGYY